MSYEITRTLEFDAAHRVRQHESKCRTLHGHRYKVEVTAWARELDAIGRVIDFSVIKEKLGAWIDTHWDHATILMITDPLVKALQNDQEAMKPPFVVAWNPTAENMARFLFNKASELLNDSGLEVTRVVVWETPNCRATWEPPVTI